MSKAIPLADNLSALLDDQDYLVANALGPWNVHYRGGNSPQAYVRRGFSVGGKSLATMLHHFVALRAGLDVTKPIAFENGNQFDMRRQNLVVVEGGRRYPERAKQLQTILNKLAGQVEAATAPLGEIAEAVKAVQGPKRVYEACNARGEVLDVFPYDQEDRAKETARRHAGFVRPATR